MKRERKNEITHNEVFASEDEGCGGVWCVFFDVVERDGVADFDLGSGSHDEGVINLNRVPEFYARREES